MVLRKPLGKSGFSFSDVPNGVVTSFSLTVSSIMPVPTSMISSTLSFTWIVSTVGSP